MLWVQGSLSTACRYLIVKWIDISALNVLCNYHCYNSPSAIAWWICIIIRAHFSWVKVDSRNTGHLLIKGKYPGLRKITCHRLRPLIEGCKLLYMDARTGTMDLPRSGTLTCANNHHIKHWWQIVLWRVLLLHLFLSFFKVRNKGLDFNLFTGLCPL